MQKEKKESILVTCFVLAVLVSFCINFPANVMAKTWLPPEVLDDTASADEVYQITATVTCFGHLYVAWNNWDRSTHNIYWKMRFPQRTWTSTIQRTFHDDASLGGMNPHLASGRSLVSSSPVTFLTYESTGEGFVAYDCATGASEILDSDDVFGTYQGAAIDANGIFHVVYKAWPHPFQLYHRRYSDWPLPSGWSTPNQVTSTTSMIYSYDVAACWDRVAREETAHVVWTQRQVLGDSYLLYYAKYSEDSGWEAPILLASGPYLSGVKIANSNGPEGQIYLHLVWEGRLDDGSTDIDIFYKSRLGAWGDDVNLSDDAYASKAPSMILSGDNVHVVWERNAGADGVINYRKYDGSWQPVEELTSGADLDQGTNPFITANPWENLYVFYAGDAGAIAPRLMLREFGNPSAYTPTGSDVEVEVGDHTVTFHEVTDDGVTTISSSSEGSELPPDLMQSCTPPQYFNVTTTASHFGYVQICLSYDDTICDEDGLRLWYNKDGTLVDVTDSIDTTNNIICGIVWGLSEFVLACPRPPEVWVDDDYTPKGYNGGHTWGYDAFDTIQEGIDMVSSPGTAHVLEGKYVENISLKSGVEILGAGPRVTTINGGRSGHVVSAYNVDSQARLEGFTIINGSASNFGGGMYNFNSSPQVSECIFRDNSASEWGGGMGNWSSSPRVNNCIFLYNSAKYGGGMDNEASSSPTVINCTFSKNSASGWGGGMNNYNKSSPQVANCIFVGNEAKSGGGMFNEHYSGPEVTNCVFSRNKAVHGGGMGNKKYSSPIVTNCTFWGNTATSLKATAGGMLNEDNSSPTVTNSIFWNDTPREIYNYSSSPTITYCDSQDGIYIGQGCISKDPKFVDPNNGDFHLQPYSPCIDHGNNKAVNPPYTDFEGDPRVIDGNGDFVPRVDMGADEFRLTFKGDFDKDGDVDGFDLAVFVAGGTGISLEELAKDFGKTD